MAPNWNNPNSFPSLDGWTNCYTSCSGKLLSDENKLPIHTITGMSLQFNRAKWKKSDLGRLHTI